MSVLQCLPTMEWLHHMHPNASEWMLPLCFALMGACIGSFLNVVVYRVPRGMSVSKPRRSFCPSCGADIPWHLNLPLLSWLMLRGRSACCRRRIAVRYWLVEVACALLFFSVAWCFSYESIVTQLLICLWGAALLALLAMDWEQMVVHPPLAVGAVACGVGAASLDPTLVESSALDFWDGALWSVGGALGAYLLFRLVALGGRLAFGKRTLHFDEPQEWSLRQAGEDIILTVAGKDYLWTEIFPENGARVELADAQVKQLSCDPGRVLLEADSIRLPGGDCKSLESYDELSGICRGIVLRREAMGSGDAWLALAIGALCGWQGVVFALVGGSVIGLLFALVMRVRRGAPMPFGPALILAAYLWLFWGPRLLDAYLELITR